jgi:hypothetical protein
MHLFLVVSPTLSKKVVELMSRNDCCYEWEFDHHVWFPIRIGFWTCGSAIATYGKRGWCDPLWKEWNRCRSQSLQQVCPSLKSLANDSLILAVNQIALAEGVALGKSLGIDPVLLHSVVNSSSGMSSPLYV